MDLGTAILIGFVAIAVSTATSVGIKAVAKEQAGSNAELDALRTRAAELEERLDFAERVLTNTEASARLPGRLDS
jgi:hypothetical protein